MTETATSDEVQDAGAVAREVLNIVTSRLAGAESRPGQEEMVAAVASALSTGRHLVVEAGTGVGKSLGYLVPVFLAVSAPADSPAHIPRIVVATATKALQDQVASKDVPFLDQALADQDVSVRTAVLKGRSSYLCKARLDERITSPTLEQGDLSSIVQWTETTTTGDRDDLETGVSDEEWSRLSVSSLECPGAATCPFGSVCFAENARRRAATADVVITNTALYAAHLASDGQVLPEHDAVVLDEAHVLEDVVTSAFGKSVSAARLMKLAARAAGIPAEPLVRLRNAASALSNVLESPSARVDPGSGDLFVLLTSCGAAVDSVRAAVDAAISSGSIQEGMLTRFQQASRYAEGLTSDLDSIVGSAYPTTVSWIEAGALRSNPVSVGEVLENLFASHTVIATSATLTVADSFELIARRWGLPVLSGGDPDGWDALQVQSPFPYTRHAYLWTPEGPFPGNPDFAENTVRRIDQLARAANGRTLVLFTSHEAMVAAAADLDSLHPPYRVLVQGTATRSALLEDLGPGSILLGLASFWTGVDIPGTDLVCVIIPRLPFPRPDDPLYQARREAATRNRVSWFRDVDLPYAAQHLAQGAGRLVRSATDRGAVVILDPRLTRSGYGPDLVASLPPFRRVDSQEQVLGALRWLDAQES